jgi:hypothetical protein
MIKRRGHGGETLGESRCSIFVSGRYECRLALPSKPKSLQQPYHHGNDDHDIEVRYYDEGTKVCWAG